MKYLKTFESVDYLSLIKDINSLKYILEDEGYSIVIYDCLPQLHDSMINISMKIVEDIGDNDESSPSLSQEEYQRVSSSDFFNEFIDRVKDICKENDFIINYLGGQMRSLCGTWMVSYIPKKYRPLNEFHNSTSLWKTGVNYPETQTRQTIHPDSLGKDYNYLTTSEILIYLNKNNNIKKTVETSGKSTKISFEMNNFEVSVYRSLVEKNNFEYLIEIDGEEVDCKNEVGEKIFTILYAKKLNEEIGEQDRLNQIVNIFNEYKYILEDEGVSVRTSVESPYRANQSRIRGRIIIYLLIQNTDIFKNTQNGDDVIMNFIYSDYYQEFADRFLEDIYNKGLSDKNNVETRFGGNNGIIIRIGLT